MPDPPPSTDIEYSSIEEIEKAEARLDKQYRELEKSNAVTPEVDNKFLQEFNKLDRNRELLEKQKQTPPSFNTLFVASQTSERKPPMAPISKKELVSLLSPLDEVLQDALAELLIQHKLGLDWYIQPPGGESPIFPTLAICVIGECLGGVTNLIEKVFPGECLKSGFSSEVYFDKFKEKRKWMLLADFNDVVESSEKTYRRTIQGTWASLYDRNPVSSGPQGKPLDILDPSLSLLGWGTEENLRKLKPVMKDILWFLRLKTPSPDPNDMNAPSLTDNADKIKQILEGLPAPEQRRRLMADESVKKVLSETEAFGDKSARRFWLRQSMWRACRTYDTKFTGEDLMERRPFVVDNLSEKNYLRSEETKPGAKPIGVESKLIHAIQRHGPQSPSIFARLSTFPSQEAVNEGIKNLVNAGVFVWYGVPFERGVKVGLANGVTEEDALLKWDEMKVKRDD